MAFVVSSGELALTGAGVTRAFAPMPMPAAPWEYEMIWRTQPQVRTVVQFLARNVAQLGVHVFRREADNNRVRLTDHPMARLLAEPVPGMTMYRWVERLMADYALFDNAYALKLNHNGRSVALPIPPKLIRPKAGNWIAPERYETAGGRDFEPAEVMHIRGYSPETLTHGTSPIESLRDLLLESSESAKQRREMWRSGARMTGVLTRPVEAPDWDPKDRTRFQEMWRTFAAGGGAEGGTPLLEDGIAYQPIGINPEQAQYIEARKLTREEVAAAWFIPPPLIGILDHATYSNIKEQHKHLYQDTLGPYLVMFEQELGLQLLPDLPGYDAASTVYCEFNIAGKLRGSFEEQAAAMSTMVGGPVMTRNEGRGRLNLPSLPGADELIVPMNVVVGGLASPQDTAPPAVPKARGGPMAKSSRPEDLGTAAAERDALMTALTAFSDRKSSGLAALAEAAVAAAKLAKADAPDDAPADPMPDLLALWAQGHDDRLAQLQQLLTEHGFRLAQLGAWDVLDTWNPDAEGWDADVMLAWILGAAETHAKQHEQAGTDAITAVVAEGGDGWRDGLKAAAAVWGAAAAVRGRTAATETRSFGGHDAAGASGLTKKVWRTGGKNPRPSHKAQDGERVSLDDVFSNGLRWPGDGTGKTDELVNCNCDLTYAKEE